MRPTCNAIDPMPPKLCSIPYLLAATRLRTEIISATRRYQLWSRLRWEVGLLRLAPMSKLSRRLVFRVLAMDGLLVCQSELISFWPLEPLSPCGRLRMCTSKVVWDWDTSEFTVSYSFRPTPCFWALREWSFCSWLYWSFIVFPHLKPAFLLEFWFWSNRTWKRFVWCTLLRVFTRFLLQFKWQNCCRWTRWLPRGLGGNRLRWCHLWRWSWVLFRFCCFCCGGFWRTSLGRFTWFCICWVFRWFGLIFTWGWKSSHFWFFAESPQDVFREIRSQWGHIRFTRFCHWGWGPEAGQSVPHQNYRWRHAYSREWKSLKVKECVWGGQWFRRHKPS